MPAIWRDTLSDWAFRRLNRKARRYLEERGVQMEDPDGFFCTAMPSVTLQSLVDDEIRVRDFAGAIVLRKGCCFVSEYAPFPHSHERLTVVKHAGGIGRIIVGSGGLNGTTIISYERVEIHDRVLFGPNVIIMDCDGHLADRHRVERQGHDEPGAIRPVTIGRRAWLGYGCMIHKGVTVGEYAVVGAGSVVVKDVPPCTVVAGNPARVIRTFEPGGPDVAERAD